MELKRLSKLVNKKVNAANQDEHGQRAIDRKLYKESLRPEIGCDVVGSPWMP